MNSGIYRVLCPTGHYYIGSTENFSKRWQEHTRMLQKGKHANKHMQNRFDKYPIGWTFEVIERITPDRKQLIAVEQKHLSSVVGKDPMCMNINESAERPSRAGICIPHTEETKRKLSIAHQGLKASIETRLKMSNAHKGKVKTAAHRANLSKSCTGRQLTLETRMKKSAALKGRPWSEARRLAQSRKGLQLA